MAWTEQQKAALAGAMVGSRTASGATIIRAQAPQAAPRQPYQPKSSSGQQVLQKLGAIASTTWNVGKAVGSAVTQELKELPGEAYRTATRVVPTLLGAGIHSEIRQQQERNRVLEKTTNHLFNEYKAGRISKEDYSKGLREVSSEYNEIGREAIRLEEKADPKQAVEDIVDTALLITTFGMGKIASAAAKPGGAFLGRVLRPESLQVATKLNLGLEAGLKKIPGGYFNKLLDDSIKEVNQARASLNLGKVASKKTLSATDDVVKRVMSQIPDEFGRTLSELSTAEIAKATASKLLIKYPLTYHMAFDDTRAVFDSLSKGDMAGATGRLALASTALLSGPISAAVQGVKKFGINAKAVTFGRNSFIDELSSRAAGGNRAAFANIVNGFKKSDPKRYEDTMRWLKSVEAMNLYTSRGDVKLAADNISDWFFRHGNDISKLSPQQVFDNLEKYGRALDAAHFDLRHGLIAGITPDQFSQVLLGRFDRTVRDELAEAIAKAGTKEEALKLLDGAVDNNIAWTHNDSLYRAVRNAVSGSETVEAAARTIKAIDAQKAVGKGWSRSTRKLFKDGGYIPIIPKRITDSPYIQPEAAGKLTSNFLEGDDIIQAVKPLPGLEQVGGLLRKVGLSPEDTSATVNKLVRDQMDETLKAIDLPNVPIGESKGAWVRTKLSEYMEGLPQFPGRKLPAQDARTLTITEMQEALGRGGNKVSRESARAVQRAVLDSYTALPMSLRGLGDKIVDYAYAINPIQRAYARVQGAFRYSWNPFFRLQEISETEILSQALTGGKTPSYFGANRVIDMFFKKTANQIDDAVRLLDDRRVFSGTLGGQAADEAVIGRLTANLTKTQKRSLAGMALKLAERQGKTLDQLLNDDYEQIADALRVVVQYPRRGGLNSPLARTLNVAFFPMRYNAKVAGLAATALAKQSPAVQLAVVNGMMDFRNWLQSDEGIQWQSDNQDAIQLFKWITPYNSIEYAMRLLNGNKPESIGELGQLGGLPFGLITQMLDSQTDFEVNTPYVDLKSGKVIPEYVPESQKARAVTAVQDLINMLFTYPGRLIGLPGKNEIIRKGVRSFVPVDNSEYKITIPEDRLTPTQQRQIEVIEDYRGTDNDKYPMIWEGYTWNENGYLIPTELEQKLSKIEPKAAPKQVRVPTKAEVAAARKSKSRSNTQRVARQIAVR